VGEAFFSIFLNFFVFFVLFSHFRVFLQKRRFFHFFDSFSAKRWLAKLFMRKKSPLHERTEGFS